MEVLVKHYTGLILGLLGNGGWVLPSSIKMMNGAIVRKLHKYVMNIIQLSALLHHCDSGLLFSMPISVT